MRLLDDLGAKFPKNPQTQTENEEETTPDRDIPLPEADDCARASPEAVRTYLYGEEKDVLHI